MCLYKIDKLKSWNCLASDAPDKLNQNTNQPTPNGRLSSCFLLISVEFTANWVKFYLFRQQFLICLICDPKKEFHIWPIHFLSEEEGEHHSYTTLKNKATSSRLA